ncbi:hypothetical protein PENTCL1PPCAC_28014, partial [Pristionchus entomophagus]
QWFLFNYGSLYAGHLPIIFAVLFTINLGTTYCFAVANGHVDSIFPYVSAAGNNQPESCIFSFLLNLSAVFSIMIVCMRCALVSSILRERDRFLDRVNVWSSYIGIISGFAMMLVASVQETAIITVHLSAACVCFSFGCIYMITQAWVTIKMYPDYNNRRIGWIRMVLAIASTVCLFSAIGFGVAAAHVYHSVYPGKPTPRPWSRKIWMPGYPLHVVSAVSEWLLAVLHVSYILSYQREFEKLKVKFVSEALVSHLDTSPYSSHAELNP